MKTETKGVRRKEVAAHTAAERNGSCLLLLLREAQPRVGQVLVNGARSRSTHSVGAIKRSKLFCELSGPLPKSSTAIPNALFVFRSSNANFQQSMLPIHHSLTTKLLVLHPLRFLSRRHHTGTCSHRCLLIRAAAQGSRGKPNGFALQGGYQKPVAAASL